MYLLINILLQQCAWTFVTNINNTNLSHHIILQPIGLLAFYLLFQSIMWKQDVHSVIQVTLSNWEWPLNIALTCQSVCCQTCWSNNYTQWGFLFVSFCLFVCLFVLHDQPLILKWEVLVYQFHVSKHYIANEFINISCLPVHMKSPQVFIFWNE